MYKLQPAPERRYVFSAPTRIAAGARDLSRRNVSTAQTRTRNSKASFAHQHPCGPKTALLRSRGDHARHIQAVRRRKRRKPRARVVRVATTLNRYSSLTVNGTFLSREFERAIGALFGFRASFGFRHSDFVIVQCLTSATTSLAGC